ncbi:hypothetical protein HYPSUDRAFT_46213 [Hypholoma sublateritium FD-334 SS-4]|uniref:Uncharacterized protein n=1 Tax=Hypholoma sublateritium (strain FD-334 SS-4) TaxID=945553 RepID=A0A0D2PB94_HYPSF|nr:hypothetical protein HYPSUDRAFT_46213 [Hypholoma sublateritium FD-334 SS-4]
MSSPIAIRRAASPASGSECSSASSPTRALYVPLHRRTPSAASDASASRPSSPAHTQPQATEQHPRIYAPATLLALRPAGPDAHGAAAKAHIRAACPAVLASSRARKHAAFLAKQSRQAPAPPSLGVVPALAESAPAVDVGVLPPVVAQRVAPRRTRPVGRGPERRRAALQLGDNWRAMRALAPPAPVSVL